MSGARLEPIAVALDTADRPTFDAWVERFAPRVGVLKVGLEAFVRFGVLCLTVTLFSLINSA